MTYEQYWDGDPAMTKYYQKCSEINLERESQRMWLQGLYIYDALLRVAPLYDFMSSKRVAQSYVEAPYPVTPKRNQQAREDAAKKKLANDLDFVKSWAESFNKQFKGGREGVQ